MKTFKFGHPSTSLILELQGDNPIDALKKFVKTYDKTDLLYRFFAKNAKELYVF